MDENKKWGMMRVLIRLERDLPSVKAGAEWWYPCEGEWIVEATEVSADLDRAMAVIRSMTPEIISANRSWFAIIGFEVFKEIKPGS